MPPVAVLDFSGPKLRAERNRAGLSRKALADMACRGADTIAQYERSRQRPSTQAVRALARALGVEYADLLSCEDAPTDAV